MIVRRLRPRSFVSLARELSGFVARELSGLDRDPRRVGMNRTAWLQERRMLKFRDVLSRWEASELSAMEASELLGMSERQFRRYRGRYEDEGEAGLLDRRLGKASPRRVPESDRRRVLDLYREMYQLERSAFSRPAAEPSWVFVGLQLDEDAAAASGTCRAHGQTRSA